jgi:hypothetical protein
MWPRRQRLLQSALGPIAIAAIAGNLRAYGLAREFTMVVVHQTRAAAAIADWDPGLSDWVQELHLPAPQRLRDLIARDGTPARDALFPWLVPAIPPSISRDACVQLDPNAVVAACVAGVDARVGR